MKNPRNIDTMALAKLVELFLARYGQECLLQPGETVQSIIDEGFTWCQWGHWYKKGENTDYTVLVEVYVEGGLMVFQDLRDESGNADGVAIKDLEIPLEDPDCLEIALEALDKRVEMAGMQQRVRLMEAEIDAFSASWFRGGKDG